MTLATRSAIWLSTIFVVVFGAAVLLSLDFFEERFVAAAGQFQLRLLQEYAQSLEEKIDTAHTTLGGAGKLVDAKMLASPAQAQQFLESRIYLQSSFSQGLFLFDAAGRQVASSPARLQATATETALVRATLNQAKPGLSLAFSRQDAPLQPLIALSAPILGPRGEILGVVQGSLRLLDGHYAGGLAQVRIGDTGYVYMVDKHRTMLFHPDPARRLALATKPGQNQGLDRAIAENFEGSVENVNSTGLQALTTFVQLKSLGWVLAANFPMTEVREPFRRSLATVAGVALAASVAVFFAVTLLVRRLLLPVRQLTQHLAAVGQGRARPLPSQHTGEWGLLTQAYNQMLAELNTSEAARMDGERRLRDLNATLEHRVDERTEELENANVELHLMLGSNLAMKNELVRAEKLAALGKMVAGLAHELNTPIGNALLAASALRMRTDSLGGRIDTGSLKRSEWNDFQTDSVGAAALIENNLSRAAGLINNFKQVAVDQTAEHRRVFDADTTIAEVLSTLDYLVRHRHIVVHRDLHSGVAMDSYPGPLGQVIINFFTNALTHAFADDGVGEIWITCTQENEDQVKIAFRDNGVGIPPDHLEKIFDPFFTTRLGQGGSGLGLSIAYNIATGMLGGQILVHSSLGVGTVFTVLLPRVAPDLTAV